MTGSKPKTRHVGEEIPAGELCIQVCGWVKGLSVCGAICVLK